MIWLDFVFSSISLLSVAKWVERSLSAEGHEGFEPGLGQLRNLKSGTCCFPG